ncbi:hypothetical protein [Halostagnicola kamekurae]|uniref:Uncharacterized protein n=1 Tax=Halostagnicola kamekurae TaxID=619731 RepID=A0A1I6PYQ5_9EURY|nr:hypothetical protein [Halostagnicola kamekurae]SFS45333.1 hypothetical protein SAMN04488556_0873 [Halostagnicola kamekurae]
MSDRNEMNRRNILKGATVAGIGSLCLSGSATANNNKSNELTGETDFSAENYVESDGYIYRRVDTAEAKMLLRFDLEKGEAVFAKMGSTNTTADESRSVSTVRSSEDEELRDQTRSMTAAENVTIQSTDSYLNPVKPEEIVEATKGIQLQSSGVIFEQVDVETEYIGDCGTVGYDEHNYYHVAMELGDYEFDDLDTLGMGAVCDALFILVGKKSKTIKKLLKKISDTPLIRILPDGICALIFEDILDGIFSGGDGTFAVWDRESGGLISTPELAVGGSSEYDPEPSDLRDGGPEETYTGVHTEALL